MNDKLNKNQWVAVIVSLAAAASIVFFSFRSSPENNVKGSANSLDSLKTFETMENQDYKETFKIKDSYQDTEELLIEEISKGEGKTAESGNKVSVNYAGFLLDGTKFDSSWDRGAPFEFTIGEGFVIQGWEIGVKGMQEGEVRRLVIPPSLGYGENQIGPIPPNSILVFTVELLEVKD